MAPSFWIAPSGLRCATCICATRRAFCKPSKRFAPKLSLQHAALHLARPVGSASAPHTQRARTETRFSSPHAYGEVRSHELAHPPGPSEPTPGLRAHRPVHHTVRGAPGARGAQASRNGARRCTPPISRARTRAARARTRSPTQHGAPGARRAQQKGGQRAGDLGGSQAD